MESMPVVDKTRSSLGFVTKLAYGAGTMGISATGIMLASYLMVFLTDVAGLPAALASWALVIGQFSDAISDPIVGMLSDRTRTRWGRRYPWIVVGAIPFGLSFFLLWLIPVQGNDWLLFTYYVVVGIIYKTCYTAVYLPYVSLTPELSQGYNERTNLNSFRFAFAIGSNIFAIFVSGIALSQIESPPHKYLAIGALGAFLCIIPLYLCVLGTHRHVIPNEQRRAHVTAKTSSLPLRQQLRIAFSNRPFLLVVGIYLCSWLAAQITMVVMVYFVLYWIQATYEVFTLFALFVLGTAFLMLFVWSEVSRKVGKKAVYC
ncbi:MAG: MFS transporter, partial [Leptolyngbyaceae cyanobacterium]